MDKREEIVMLLSQTFDYYGKELSAKTAEMYLLGLADMSADEVRQALSAHMRNPDKGMFVPKVADLVAFRHGGADAAADKAWSKVRQSVGDVGGWRSVVFDDALIHAVVAMMGGWGRFCACESDEALMWMGKDFVRIYKGLWGRELPDYPRVLPGAAEIHNSAHGHAVAPPVLVGDAAVARLVYQGGSDAPLLPARTMRVADVLQALPLGGAA